MPNEKSRPVTRWYFENQWLSSRVVRVQDRRGFEIIDALIKKRRYRTFGNTSKRKNSVFPKDNFKIIHSMGTIYVKNAVFRRSRDVCPRCESEQYFDDDASYDIFHTEICQ